MIGMADDIAKAQAPPRVRQEAERITDSVDEASLEHRKTMPHNMACSANSDQPRAGPSLDGGLSHSPTSDPSTIVQAPRTARARLSDSPTGDNRQRVRTRTISLPRDVLGGCNSELSTKS